MFLREPLGLEDEVLVETADGTRVKVVTAAEEEFPEGVLVRLEFKPQDLYLFDHGSKVLLCDGVS